MKWNGPSGKPMFHLLMKIQGQQVLWNFMTPYLQSIFLEMLFDTVLYL